MSFRLNTKPLHVVLWWFVAALPGVVALAVAPAVARAHGTELNDKVPVELEWEEIPGATIYELEFQNMQGQPMVEFKSDTHVFKFRMKVGKYQVRSRVADYRKVFGPWSPLTEFAVEPKAPFFDPASSARTAGKISAKTLTSEVLYRWGSAVGADEFKLVVTDGTGKVVIDETTRKFYHRAQLPAGEYTATLAAIGNDGVSSSPVVISEKLVIQSVRLRPPEILFEPGGHLSLSGELPLVRWKPVSGRVVAGTLEYRFFFGDDWLPVQKFSTHTAHEMILDKATKPGRYRLTLWSESTGLVTSENVTYEFVIKPKTYGVHKMNENTSREFAHYFVTDSL
jgi:hypothetical protein